jgi:hypothetical protein
MSSVGNPARGSGVTCRSSLPSGRATNTLRGWRLNSGSRAAVNAIQRRSGAQTGSDAAGQVAGTIRARSPPFAVTTQIPSSRANAIRSCGAGRGARFTIGRSGWAGGGGGGGGSGSRSQADSAIRTAPTNRLIAGILRRIMSLRKGRVFGGFCLNLPSVS